MPAYATNRVHPPKPLMPAWVFSIAVHSAMIALLCAAMQPAPRGNGLASRGSMGLVLNRSNTEGTQNEGIKPDAQQAALTVDSLPPPNLLTLASNDEVATRAKQSDVSQNAPKPVSKTNSAKQNSKPSGPGGKKNARPGAAVAGLGSSAGSGYGQTSVFGVEGKGNKFIYLFDRSSSMEGPPLSAAKKQLLQSLQSLEGTHQFHIIFFNTRTQSFDATGGGHRIAFASDRNKKLAANFVGGITADGGTDRMVALRDAIAYSPDVIFFLTDADDPMSPNDLAEISRANRKAQAAICVIEFGRTPAPVPDNFLARLAKESGGQYGYVNTATLR